MLAATSERLRCAGSAALLRCVRFHIAPRRSLSRVSRSAPRILAGLDVYKRQPYDSLYLLQHFMNNTFQSLDYQKLSSAAIVICLIMALIIGALLFADDRIGGSVEE